MPTKTRYCYVDAIKTVAIFFVCSYHFWSGGDYVYSETMGASVVFHRFLAGVLSTCVPLFLVANGAVLLNRPFDAKKHYKSLAVLVGQYTVWRGISILMMGRHIGYSFRMLSVQELINHFLLFQPIDGIDEVHLWFIPMLCCIYLLYPFYKKVFDEEGHDSNSRITLMVLMGVLVFFNFCSEDFPIYRMLLPQTKDLDVKSLEYFDPFFFFTGTMSLYFLVGGFLHKYREKVVKIPAWVCVLAILGGMTLLLIGWYIACTNWGHHYDNIFGSYDSTPTLLCVLGISVLALKAETLLTKHGKLAKLVNCIGSNTISVYYTHWMLGYFLLPHLPIPNGILGNFLKAALFVAFGTLFGEVLKRIPVLRKLVR